MSDADRIRALVGEVLGDAGLRETLRQVGMLAGFSLLYRDSSGLVLWSEGADAGGAPAATVPFRHRGRDIGSWSAIPENGGPGGEEAARTTAALAGRILGERIQAEEEKNALSSEILQKYQELNTLYHVSEGLASAQDPHSVGEEILREAVDGVSPCFAVLRVYEAEDFMARTLVAHGFRPRRLNHRERVDEASFLWEVINRGRPVLVTRVGETPDFARRLGCDFPGLSIPPDASFLGIPLRTAERAMGALLLLGKTDGRPFTAEDVKFLNTVASQAAISLGHLRLAENSQELFLSTVWALSDAIDMKDQYTRGHSQRVARYSIALAQALDWGSREIRELEVSALLHDVGKIGISEAILQKPGKLTQEEKRRVEAHPVLGEQIVGNVRLLERLTGNVRLHHENWDGIEGYPDRLRGEDIPPAARIIHIADTFDAMTSSRVYRSFRSMEYVLSEYQRCRASMFDPEMTDAFVRLIREGIVRPHESEPETSEHVPASASGAEGEGRG